MNRFDYRLFTQQEGLDPLKQESILRCSTELEKNFSEDIAAHKSPADYYVAKWIAYNQLNLTKAFFWVIPLPF